MNRCTALSNPDAGSCEFWPRFRYDPRVLELGTQHADAVRDGLVCPACDYSLRGLAGDVVSCPECGAVCDVLRLIAERWDKPWYQAPGMRQLSAPLVLFVLGAIAAFFISLTIPSWLDPNPPYEPIKVMLISALMWSPFPIIWLSAVRRCWRVWRSCECLGLLLLNHCILVAYVFGAMGILGGLLLLATFFSGLNPAMPTASVGLLVFSINAFACAYLGERFVARRCIRQYFRTRVVVKAPAATAPV